MNTKMERVTYIKHGGKRKDWLIREKKTKSKRIKKKKKTHISIVTNQGSLQQLISHFKLYIIVVSKYVEEAKLKQKDWVISSGREKQKQKRKYNELPSAFK